MKLLFDHNLPPRLANQLADLFPESQHVHELDLSCATDREVYDFAQQRGFVVVTNSEFLDIAPEALIWIHCGSCSVEDVADLLRKNASAILAMGEDEQTRTGVLLIWRLQTPSQGLLTHAHAPSSPA